MALPVPLRLAADFVGGFCLSYGFGRMLLGDDTSRPFVYIAIGTLLWALTEMSYASAGDQSGSKAWPSHRDSNE